MMEEEKEEAFPFILNQEQEKLSPLPFGLGSMGRNGCGAAAVYNALILLGERPSLRELIYSLERKGAAFFGLAGTTPSGIRRVFSDRGFPVKEIKTPSEAELSEVQFRFPVFILLCAPGGGLFPLHYVTIYAEHGSFQMLNALFPWKTGRSLGEVIRSFNRGRAKAVLLFCLSGHSAANGHRASCPSDHRA